MQNKRKNIVIVGGNAAGPAAAAKAKRVDPSANVLMIEASEFISTGTCEMPYLISGEIESFKKVVFFNSESFEEEKGVKVLTQHLAESIDRKEKRVMVKNLLTGENKFYEFDRLILTTGAKARRLSELPLNLTNVFTLKSMSDYVKLESYLSSRKIKNVGIIGAGFIGLESAEAFKKIGCNVTIWDVQDLPLPNAENEIRNLVKERLDSHGVSFIGNAKLQYGISNGKVAYVKNGSELIEVDLLLVSAGIIPNTELALIAGLKIGDKNGIRVNNKLQTSDPNIFAAGDNIEIKNALSGEYQLLPVATLAHQFGHIAGGNAAGENNFIPPVIKNIAVKIFDDIYAETGLTESEVKRTKTAYASVAAVVPNIIRVMPESRKVFGKLIYERRTGRILGASFLGGNEASYFADFISGMISMKATVDDVQRIHLNYTPPASPFINLLSVLTRKAARKR